MTQTARRSDRNWTLVKLMYRDPCPVSEQHPAGWKRRCEKYVVNDGLKSRAEQTVTRWLAEDPARCAHLHVVYYYPRSYVDDYRALTAAGRVIA